MSSCVKNSCDSTCRACLKFIRNPKKKIYLFDIFQNESVNILKISDLFEKYTLIAVQEGDSLPKYICAHCYRKLKNFHEFCNECIESNENLLKQKDSVVAATEIQNFVKSEQTEKEFLASNVSYNRAECSEELNRVKVEELIVEKTAKPDEIVNESWAQRDAIVENDDRDIGNFESDTEELEFAGNSSKSDNDTDKCDNNDKLRMESKTKFKCDFCKAGFSIKEQYNAHLRRHAGLKPYPCNQCDKSFAKPSTLKEHIKIDHSTDDSILPRLECDHCGKIFFRKTNLRAHIRKKHMDSPKTIKKYNYNAQNIMCDQCGKLVSCQSKLLEHIRQIHSKSEKKLRCSICSKFVFESKMNRHLKLHENRKHNICSICGLGYVSKYDLNRHMTSHSTEKQFSCEMCPQRFSLEEKLRRHINVVHLKMKKYLCTYCHQSFGASQTLKDHIFTHTGEKRFKCETCGKGFIQRTSFKVHLKTHK